MNIFCHCCGQKYENTGMTCYECTSITICNCGERWCNQHQHQLYLEHQKVCTGWAQLIQRFR